MGKKIDLDREELYQKYKIEHLSQRKLAEYYGCSIDAIVRNLRDYEIESNTNSDYCVNQVHLTARQLEVLDGAMLGDGCLLKHKNGINPQLSYMSKSEQHVRFVGKFFEEYYSRSGIRENTRFDSRTNKIYKRFGFKTLCDCGFVDEYERWYVNGKKHIPEDLVLTPLMCLIWYIGDGCLCNNQKTQYIILSTNCFDKSEQERILIPQLSQFDAKLIKAAIGSDGNQQYQIYIPRRKEKAFLEYIGPCPFSDYAYKWDYKEYKPGCVPPRNHDHNKEKFCEMYKDGVRLCEIARHFGVSSTVVSRCLIKNGLYQMPDFLIKNAVVAYDKTSEKPILIFQSASLAAESVGIVPSCISQVINGRQEATGGYRWKKFLSLSEEEQVKIREQFPEYFNE
jgi:hypothetical protein